MSGPSPFVLTFCSGTSCAGSRASLSSVRGLFIFCLFVWFFPGFVCASRPLVDSCSCARSFSFVFRFHVSFFFRFRFIGRTNYEIRRSSSSLSLGRLGLLFWILRGGCAMTGTISWKRVRSTTYLPDCLSWLTIGTSLASQMISMHSHSQAPYGKKDVSTSDRTAVFSYLYRYMTTLPGSARNSP